MIVLSRLPLLIDIREEQDSTPDSENGYLDRFFSMFSVKY
jgi:hypothetical protein